MYLFYTRRARLTQNDTYLCLPAYCFDRVLPIFLILFGGSFISALIIYGKNRGSAVHDENAWWTHQYCEVTVTENNYWIKAGGIIELGCFLFFSMVFAYPLYQFLIRSNPYHTRSPSSTFGLARFNRAPPPIDDRQRDLLSCEALVLVRKQFKQVLYYNLGLSILASLTSFLTLWLWPDRQRHDQRWFIPLIDYACASITTFAMLRRNRQYVQKELCGCGCGHGCGCSCGDKAQSSPTSEKCENTHLMMQEATRNIHPSKMSALARKSFSDIIVIEPSQSVSLD